MSDINLDFIVNNNSINFTVEPNEITITPEDIQLTVYSAGIGVPSGSTGQLQYNNGGALGGVANTSYANGNLSLGSVANIQITGGAANYALITNGNGILSWGQVSDANTAVFANYANFAGNAFSVSGTNVSGAVSFATIANSVAGANVSGFVANASFANLATFATTSTTANTVANASQSNITSLGNLTGLTVDGVTTLGSVGNVKITGGLNTYYLQTDGTGNLTWAVGAGNISGNGTVAGSNTQIQFNDGGANFGGNAGFTFDKVSGNVNLPNDLIVAGNIYSNIIGSASTVTTNAQPNITSLGALANLSVVGTANITSLRINDDKIVLGNGAGANTGITGQGVAIGYFAGYTNQGDDAIAIGDAAGQTNQGNTSIAIGAGAGYIGQGNNSIILNASGTYANGGLANAFYVNPVRANVTSNVMFYNNTTNEITYGVLTVANANYANFAGTAFSVSGSNVTGAVAYATTANSVSGSNVTGAVSSSTTANTVTTNAQPNITSLGNLTGLRINNTVIHLGANTSLVSPGTFTIAIGANAGKSNLGSNSIAIGKSAGENTMAGNAVAIGLGAGSSANIETVSIGTYAGVSAGSYAIAIGTEAGQSSNSRAIAIGHSAGETGQGFSAIAIGYTAGNASQSNTAIAIGTGAGRDNQSVNSIALGTSAGISNQGQYSIAIGANAGYSNQHSNTTILNSGGVILNTTQANSLFVKPIRDVTGNVDFTVTLKYNPTTGEIGYV